MQKNIKKYFITACALTLGLYACDYVEKPLQNSGLSDVDSIPDFPPNANTQRNVLLEEFTGHTCGPCPGAAKTARDLHDYYKTLGKEFVVMSIHTFSLAVPYPPGSPKYTTDFRTDDGDYFANDLFDPAISYTPIGFVNRAAYSSSVWVDKADWQAAADIEFAKPLVANMQIITEYDSVAKTGVAFVQTEFTTNTSGNFFMVLALVQDSIIDWQTNNSAGDPFYPTGDVPNYVHRHVFRGCLTPKLGVSLVSGSVSTGQEVIKPISINLNTFPVRSAGPALKQKDLSLVAYVYNADNLEILQVIEKHLLEE